MPAFFLLFCAWFFVFVLAGTKRIEPEKDVFDPTQCSKTLKYIFVIAIL